MSEKRKSGLRQVIDGIIAISTVLAAAITGIDSYNTRGIVWQTIQTGEPVLVALILLQTAWFLFGVLFLGSIIKFHLEKKLTRERAMWSAVGTLIASFLLTWGVRASYFGATGQNYPGQALIEFRLQTIVAGILFFLFGIVVVIIAFVAEPETDEEISDLLGREPITKPEDISQLQERLREMLGEDHTPSCKTREKKCRKKDMFHYNIAKNQTHCACSCHK